MYTPSFGRDMPLVCLYQKRQYEFKVFLIYLLLWGVIT